MSRGGFGPAAPGPSLISRSCGSIIGVVCVTVPRRALSTDRGTSFIICIRAITKIVDLWLTVFLLISLPAVCMSVHPSVRPSLPLPYILVLWHMLKEKKKIHIPPSKTSTPIPFSPKVQLKTYDSSPAPLARTESSTKPFLPSPIHRRSAGSFLAFNRLTSLCVSRLSCPRGSAPVVWLS